LIASLIPSPAAKWLRFLGRPFPRLVRHCVDRILHGGESSDADGLDLSIGVVLGLLALPGIFASLFLVDKYGSLFQVIRGDLDFDPYTASLPDEYFFIVLSMVVTASVTVWKWDSLLPDRRDYNNLAPLPIRSRSFFLANLLALLLLTAILSLDVNAASIVLFPLVVCGSRTSFVYFARFLGAHSVSVVLGSIFGFLLVLAILGALMTILPFRVFRKSSLYVRFAIILFLMTVLSTSFVVPPMIHALAEHPHSLLRLLPAVWFLALCQSLLGRAGPLLHSLGGMALVATCMVLVCAVGSYAFSYRRCFTRSSETMVSLPAGGGRVASWLFALLDRLILRSPFERASFRFIIRALVRGPDQALVIGWFAGLGIVIASQTLFVAVSARSQTIERFPSAEILGVPLTLAYFLVLGLRCTFDIPASLRANWLFRLQINPQTRECSPLARKVVLTLLFPGLVLICLPLYAYFWGWRTSLIHTAIVAIMCVALTEVSLTGFRKVPFTCSAPAFKSHAIVAVLVYIFGFFVFSTFTATAEHWALHDPIRFLVFIPFFLGIWLALREWRRSLTYLDTQIIFEEKSAPAVEGMNLTYGP
jgi:hypothetical protein